jgi:sugar lactone lactonase YvrE
MLLALFVACDGPSGGRDTIAIEHGRDAGTLPTKDSSGSDAAVDSGSSISAGEPDASADDMPRDAATGGRGGAGGNQAAAGRAAPTHPSNDTSSDTDPVVDPGTTDKPVLVWLDITSNSVWRSELDGSNRQQVVTDQGISAPDSITIDRDSGYLYWTNMGTLMGGANRGTLQRMKLDGDMVETVVPMGTTNTPKQLSIDLAGQKVYWCDREGAKVWRAALDGSAPEVVVSGHGMIQLVGMALDPDKHQFYFSDRISRRIYRAGFDFPAGETSETRSDIEPLLAFNPGSMPIDIDLDLGTRQIYWTDRSYGTVERAGMDLPMGQIAENRTDIETVAALLPDTLGIALDHVENQLYFTQLSGEVWRSNLDGTNLHLIAATDSASGVSVAHLSQ